MTFLQKGDMILLIWKDKSLVCMVTAFHDGNPLQDSCLENSMDGEAWQTIVYGVTKSRTRLSDFTSLSIASTGKEDRGTGHQIVKPVYVLGYNKHMKGVD